MISSTLASALLAAEMASARRMRKEAAEEKEERVREGEGGGGMRGENNMEGERGKRNAVPYSPLPG